MSAAHRLTGSYNAMLLGSVPVFGLAMLALIRLGPSPAPGLHPDYAPTAPATRR
jgi:hypothetical protein